MDEHVIIDGNNLMHAMHAHAPIPNVGRETMVRVIDKWAHRRGANVTLVFDGPQPGPALRRQMAGARVAVLFSAPKTADDIIIEMVQQIHDPTGVRVVTSDTAIRYEARSRRCGHVDSERFVKELFEKTGEPEMRPRETTDEKSVDEKPQASTPDERRFWSETFGADDNDQFDGHDAMLH